MSLGPSLTRCCTYKASSANCGLSYLFLLCDIIFLKYSQLLVKRSNGLVKRRNYYPENGHLFCRGVITTQKLVTYRKKRLTLLPVRILFCIVMETFVKEERFEI